MVNWNQKVKKKADKLLSYFWNKIEKLKVNLKFMLKTLFKILLKLFLELLKLK